jgi:hypothetical protein
MRKILISGFFACFLIGIIFFFLKVIVVDVLGSLFAPLILFITGRDYLIIPLTLVFTFVIVLAVGSAVTRIKLQNLFNRYLRRAPANLQKARGALVMLGQDTYLLAVVIKEIKLKRDDGDIEQYYVLYSPGAPFPWAGLPVIYVKKEKVRLLKLTYGEIYGIVGSFGENTPRMLTELKS